MAKKLTGFQYGVKIDQFAAIQGGYDLDVIDLGVIDAITFLSTAKWVKKKMIGDDVAFRIDWEMIPKRLPCFGLNSRSSVKGRLSKLVQRGFLVIDETNVKTRESWYLFGHAYHDFQNLQPSTETDAKQHEPSTETDANRPPKRTQNGVLPSTVVDDYKDNTSLDNTFKSLEDEPPKLTTEQQIELDKKKRKTEFEKTLIPFLEKYGKQMLREFADYWTESNFGKRKMRFENEDFFDVSKRLATWHKRCKENIPRKQEPEQSQIYVAPARMKEHFEQMKQKNA